VLECLSTSNDGLFMAPTFLEKVREENSSKSKTKATVCGDFKRKLDSLIKTLRHTNTNFVRCIKASNPLTAGRFTAGLVLNQLRYTGMLDTLKIRRVGFPARTPHKKFWETYHVLDTDSAMGDCDGLVATIQGRAAEIAEKSMAKSGSAIEENQIADAIRVGQSRKGDESLIFIREWLARELDSERAITLGRQAVVIQSVYRAQANQKWYQERTAATKALTPLLRSIIQRLQYYQQKWLYLQTQNRSHLTVCLRAAGARKEYYVERAKIFYGATCKRTHELMLATVKRQEFYHLKAKFLEDELLQRERHGFSRQERLSIEYETECANQLRKEEYERGLASLEDEYATAIKEAREIEKYTIAKEIHSLEAEEAYQRACQAIKVARNHEAEEQWREKEMLAKQDQIDDVTMQRCREAMVRMGLIRNTDTACTREPLPPLPRDTTSPKFQFELEIYKDTYTSQTEAGKTVQSLESISMSHANQQQRKYVSRVADIIGAPAEGVFAALRGLRGVNGV